MEVTQSQKGKCHMFSPTCGSQFQIFRCGYMTWCNCRNQESHSSSQRTYQKRQEGHVILIRRTIHQEDITVPNMYTENTRVHNLIKWTLNVKPQSNPNTMIVTLTLILPDRPAIQTIAKQRNTEVKCCKSNGPNRLLENISPQH